MVSSATDLKLTRRRIPAIAAKLLSSRKATGFPARLDVSDVATGTLIAALVVIALVTCRDYAISNDEAVQHRYGELIIAYYASGFGDQSLFSFQNLYLYGGLFDIVAIAFSQLFSVDPFDLRHMLCALIGISGIGAAALTARSIAGPRAALITTLTLSVTGAWYGAMFNHTKDIPFAAAMIGATFFLMRIARRLPSPRTADLAAFGLLAGAALGTRVLGLLLVIYAGFAITLYVPWQDLARQRFVIQSCLRMLPALILAYLIMILAWPWAALAPLNPIRGLLAFSEFQYGIRTTFAGQTYEMANVPRLYVPTYILIRVPLLTLFGAALALFHALPRHAPRDRPLPGRDITLLALTVVFPLACQVVYHGPAFSGLRHFLFVLPALAVLAGIGLDATLSAVVRRGRAVASAAVALAATCLVWDAATLVRLHPYENLSYNSLVGGFEGASRRYDLDYWFGSMPEALHQLEAYLRRTSAVDANWPTQVYSVAVCGERLPFEKSVTLPQLRFDFRSEWDQSEFFIAPTNMNCDHDLDGKVIGTVERLGVPIAYIKDRRALTQPVATARR
jgi:hypothetical protein